MMKTRFLLVLCISLLLAACAFSGEAHIEEDRVDIAAVFATFTPTVTDTPTATFTPTDVPTATNTPTDVPTATATATETPTLAPTATITPTVALPTVTPTPTPTATVAQGVAVPANFTATVQGPNSVLLSWGEVAQATAYRIERSTDGVNFVWLTTRGVGILSHDDTTVAAGATYYYRLRAINSTLGNSNWTPVVSVTTPVGGATATPTPPTSPLACNYTIPASASAFDGSGIPPGATVCMPAGTRGKIEIANLNGTASNPILLVPDGGVVTVQVPGDASQLFRISDASFVKMDGSAAGSQCGTYIANGMPQPYATQQCGFRVIGGANGIMAYKNVTNLEFKSIEVANSHPDATFAAGFMVRDSNGGTFTDLLIHNTYVHDTGNECVYISYAVSQQISPFINARVKNNYFQRCGWDGTDFKQTAGGEFAYNIIETAGIPDSDPASDGEGKGLGIIYSSNIWVHHNRIGGVPHECIKTLQSGTGANGKGIVIEYNELYNCGDEHVRDLFTSADTIVRWNKLWTPGTGIDVRGTGAVHDNIWMN